MSAPLFTTPSLATVLPAPAGWRCEVRCVVELRGESLQDRRSRIAQALGLPSGAPVALTRQVHGGRLLEAAGEAIDPSLAPPEADGLWTARPDHVVVAQSADCVPVVVSDAKRPFVAALHSGWRGTRAALLAKTLRLAMERGTSPVDLHVWIGPHISQGCYEVSPELADDFRAQFGSGAANGRQLHLAACLRAQARSLGVPDGNVAECGVCTYADPAGWPSYRREGPGRGRSILTLAVLRALAPERSA